MATRAKKTATPTKTKTTKTKTKTKAKTATKTKTETKTETKTKSAKSANVLVTKMSVPFSPSGCALSPDGSRLIVSTDSRPQGEKAPSLVLFDLTKKRAALSLNDAGTVVLERAPETKYMYGPPLWLPGDRIVFVRPDANDRHELVLRTPVAGGPTSTLGLGESGGIVGVNGDRVCVTSAERLGGEHVCQIYALPDPGSPFAKPLYENKEGWPYGFAGARLWMIDDKGFVGVDVEGRQSRLRNAPEAEGDFRLAGHGDWLVYWRNYVLQGIDIEHDTVSTIDVPAFTYKNAVATHDGRAIVVTTNGEMALVNFTNKKILWQKKISGARSSPDHVAFAADGMSAVAGAAYEPFCVYKLAIA